MIYFANPTGSPYIKQAIADRELGLIDTPSQGNIRPPNAIWCADNGCFGRHYDEDAWWAWLRRQGSTQTCVFATAPDVVGDAAATAVRSLPWLDRIRDLGYPAAFVAQNGIETTEVPWDRFDVLFVGGTRECPACWWIWPGEQKNQSHKYYCQRCGTLLVEWKDGKVVRKVADQARDHGKWVHVGRVNTLRRLKHCNAAFPDGVGADSVDGTFLTYGPHKNWPSLRRWLRELPPAQPHPVPAAVPLHAFLRAL